MVDDRTAVISSGCCWPLSKAGFAADPLFSDTVGVLSPIVSSYLVYLLGLIQDVPSRPQDCYISANLYPITVNVLYKQGALSEYNTS